MPVKHLKFTRTLFTQILKNMYHTCVDYYLRYKRGTITFEINTDTFYQMLKTCITNVNGLIFVIYAQLLFVKHGHTNIYVKNSLLNI